MELFLSHLLGTLWHLRPRFAYMLDHDEHRGAAGGRHPDAAKPPCNNNVDDTSMTPLNAVNDFV